MARGVHDNSGRERSIRLLLRDRLLLTERACLLTKRGGYGLLGATGSILILLLCQLDLDLDLVVRLRYFLRGWFKSVIA